VDEDGTPAGEPGQHPHAPFAPEDGFYQALVSEYVGLQRAGADVLGAALITAAHAYIALTASAAGRQQQAGT
jgi:hypothetical protein